MEAAPDLDGREKVAEVANVASAQPPLGFEEPL